MTEKTGHGGDLWDDDVDDDEQTKVAMNPLYRSSAAPHSDLTRSQSRHVSSFGAPRSSHPPAGDDVGLSAAGRPSLYDRLLQSGALDQSLTVAAKYESARPLAPEPLRTVSQELPPPPDLRDLAEALEGSGDGRDSSDELRESDLDLLAVSPPPMRSAKPGHGVSPAAGMPRPIPVANVPSMLLGPDASTRNDVTERFSHMPSTHPLANSIAPSAPSVRPAPPASRHTPVWLYAAAAVLLVGLGAAIGRVRAPAVSESASEAETAVPAEPVVATAAPKAPALVEPAPAPSADSMPALPAPEPTVTPVTSPADESAQHSQAAERPRAERPSPRASGEGPVAAPQPVVTSLPSVATAPVVAAATEPAATEPAARPTPAAPTGPLPAQPSREQVVAAMESVVPALTQCTGDKHGTANVIMTVRGAGSVSYALVEGSFAGTPEGSCIARVIKQARFPAFTDPSIRVAYPFQL